VPSIVLACLAYLSVALPASTLGLLWPSMRLGFHQPVGALGALLAFGVGASIISSVATGRLMACVRVGTLVPVGTLVVAAALGEEAVAPSLWVFAIGTVLVRARFGALDSAINAHAASHFGARDINWVHASYGLGATVGPLATTAVLGAGLSWRWGVRDNGCRPRGSRLLYRWSPGGAGLLGRRPWCRRQRAGKSN